MPIDRRDGSESEESGEVLEDVDPVTVDAPLEGNATPLAEQDQQEEAKRVQHNHFYFFASTLVWCLF